MWLTIRELLGTWADKTLARFTVGETVVGIVRSVRNTAPLWKLRRTLPALRKAAPLAPGQAVSVYIKNILPEKMKIKLVIVNHALSQPHRFELRYFITEGHLDRWVYSHTGMSQAH